MLNMKKQKTHRMMDKIYSGIEIAQEIVGGHIKRRFNKYKSISQKIVWATLLLLSFSRNTGIAQCNQQLVELAAELSGADAIYIRDFKVKLSPGNMENPNPTGKFPIYLNKGVNYRFTIANATEFKGKAYLELIRRGQKYMSNNLPGNGDYINSVDFECNRSATYQMLINFGNGFEGCAAVVVSMVFQDSMTFIEPRFQPFSSTNKEIYLWGQHTFQVASSMSRTASFDIKASQGHLSKNGREYSIDPEKAGELWVAINVMENGKLLEQDTIYYTVVLPPLPQIVLPGQSGGMLSLMGLNATEQLKLIYPQPFANAPYTLKEFSLSKSRSGVGRLVSFNQAVSARQFQFIRNMEVGDRMYIIDAKFIDPDGNEHVAAHQEVLITE